MQVLALRRDAQLQPAVFQQLWGRLQASPTFTVPLSATAMTAIQHRQQVRTLFANDVTLFSGGIARAPSVKACKWAERAKPAVHAMGSVLGNTVTPS